MRWTWALAAGAAALTVAAGAQARGPATVDIAMTPTKGATVPLGAPFSLRAHLTSTEALSREVVFTVSAPDGSSVPFVSRIVVVPPGLGADVDVSLTPAQWWKTTGQYRVTASVGGETIGQPLQFDVTKPATTVPVFKDVSAALGVASTLPATTCGRWSSGAAWGDVNGDGKLDLYVTRMTEPAQLFVNQGTRFTEEALARGVAWAGIPLGASFADYDNDNDQDLVVVGDGLPRLFRNDGNGRFDDVSGPSGIGGDYMGMSASWADYDNDGFLDLYIANHSRCAPTSINRGAVTYNPDRLYHNNGNGTFTDVTGFLEHVPDLTEDGSTIGAGFVAAWFDMDGNGRQDIYLANDFLGQRPDRNHLWRNDGPNADGSWQFTDISVNSGTSFSMNSMGVGIGDYDRDLDLDLAISNWGSNRLLRNNGDATFTDVATAANVERKIQRTERRGVTWGPEFADFNLDGWEDLYVAAGYLVGYLTEADTPQRNELFVNDRKGAFYDLSTPSGADDDGQSRGAAIADYDRDGRLDIYVVNQGGTSRLFRNLTLKGTKKKPVHWLEVRAVGTRSNRDGCGTWLILTTANGKQLREIHCGSTSTNSGSDKVAHFAFGTVKKIQSLEIRWPSGTRQTLRNVKTDKLLTLFEPKA